MSIKDTVFFLLTTIIILDNLWIYKELTKNMDYNHES